MQKYSPPILFFNKHIQTIVPSVFRNRKFFLYERKRFYTNDNDFLDLDWSIVGSKKLIVLLHGLEGSSQAQYIKGCVFYYNSKGYDTLSINQRGCSGLPNNLAKSYHSGATDDLRDILETYTVYKTIHLIGFSLGGNIVLKYLGESNNIPENISKAVAILFLVT